MDNTIEIIAYFWLFVGVAVILALFLKPALLLHVFQTTTTWGKVFQIFCVVPPMLVAFVRFFNVAAIPFHPFILSSFHPFLSVPLLIFFWGRLIYFLFEKNPKAEIDAGTIVQTK